MNVLLIGFLVSFLLKESMSKVCKSDYCFTSSSLSKSLLFFLKKLSAVLICFFITVFSIIFIWSSSRMLRSMLNCLFKSSYACELEFFN